MAQPSKTRSRWQYQALTFVSVVVPPAAPVPVTDNAYSFQQVRLLTSGSVEPVAFATPETITVDKWFEPLSEPVRVKPKVAYQQDLAYYYDVDVSFGWQEALSEPVRLKPKVAAQQDIAYHYDVDVSFGWQEAFADPKRVRPQAYSYPYESWSGFTPAAQFSFDYVYPWSEPVRTKPKVAWQQDLAYGYNIVVSFGWQQALSEPVRAKPKVTWQQDLAYHYDVDVSFGWQEALSDPKRIRPQAYSYPYESWSSFTPAPQFAFDYVYPWSEPVRTKPRVAWQQDFAYGYNITVSFGWLEPLSEPVRIRPKVTWQQDLAYYYDIDVSFGWQQALSEPVRIRPKVAWQQDLSYHYDVDVSFGWQEAFADPKRIRPQAYSYPYESWSTFTPVIQASFSYILPWSEPVRTKPGLGARYQQTLAYNYNVTVSFGWQEPLSEPRRSKPALQSSANPYFSFEPNPKVSFGWPEPFSEPVRAKRGLAAHQQQTAAFVKAAPFPETVTESRWHQPWSEPVRYKLALSVREQMTVPAQPWVPIAPVQIGAILGATETKDTFFGFMGLYNAVDHAYVSIHEINHVLANMSLTTPST